MSRKKILQNKDSIRLSVVHPVYKSVTHYVKMPDGELIPERKEKLIKEITLHKWLKKAVMNHANQTKQPIGFSK